MLPCSEFAAALARHPDLSLSEYNFAPLFLFQGSHTSFYALPPRLWKAPRFDPEPQTTWPFVSLQICGRYRPFSG